MDHKILRARWLSARVAPGRLAPPLEQGSQSDSGSEHSQQYTCHLTDEQGRECAKQFHTYRALATHARSAHRVPDPIASC
eukprot:6911057-Lingulodinium_polyedra.AAC.1